MNKLLCYRRGKRAQETSGKEPMRQNTLIFVEQTPHEGADGKTVPNIGIWCEGSRKSREPYEVTVPPFNSMEGSKTCITCKQKAELELPNCTRSSAVYENVCRNCVKGTGSDKELPNEDRETPAIYVVETSRTIVERAMEHWQSWRSRKGESHIRKHKELCV